MKLISIIIPAHERADSLRKTLSYTISLTDEPFEILVVDDFSISSDIHEVCRLFPEVQYHRTPANLGVIGARNHAYGLARGDIILNLDDDSYLVGDKPLRAIREALEVEGVGVVGLNIREAEGWTWPTDHPRFECRTYRGCGNAWSKKLYDDIGGFCDLFWRQGEEIDHSIRAYGSGYSVLALPDIHVVHERSPINRHPKVHAALELSNFLKRFIMLAPLRYLPEYLSRFMLLVIVRILHIDFSVLIRDLRSDRGLAAALRRRSPTPLNRFIAWRRTSY